MRRQHIAGLRRQSAFDVSVAESRVASLQAAQFNVHMVREGDRQMNPRPACLVLTFMLLNGCATLPPESGFPKSSSVALTHPEATALGQQVERSAREHPGTSGFRLLSAGIDGFLARAQTENATQRTLDLQYFILRGDESGRLLTEAVQRAADRGVRVRVLIDDGDTVAGDEQMLNDSGPTS